MSSHKQCPPHLSEGLCYDKHQVWTVTIAVTIPDILPCVLGGKWDRWARVVPHPNFGAISSAMGYRDVFVAQEVVRPRRANHDTASDDLLKRCTSGGPVRGLRSRAKGAVMRTAPRRPMVISPLWMQGMLLTF